MKQTTKMTLIQVGIALGIVLIGFILIVFVQKIKNKESYLNITHTRRETSLTSSTSKITLSTTSTTSLTTSTTSLTTSTKATTSSTTKNTTKVNSDLDIKTTKKTTTTTTTTKVTRKVTNSSTNYMNALDSWEWYIVNAINNERKKNGLKELEVAVDLRKRAEEEADYWIYISDEELKENISDYSNFASWMTLPDLDSSYKKFIEDTLNSSKVATRKNINYIGVGVIYKEKGFNSLPTVYYVLLYE